MPLFAVLPQNRFPFAWHFALHVLLLLVSLCCFAVGQRQLPYLDAARNSPIARLDFEAMYREELIAEAHNNQLTQQASFEAGTISALDMTAPQKAIKKLKQATSLLKAQRTKDAIRYLQKAIEIYPKYVSAHIVLGLAYFDLQDNRAKNEFETASELDDQSSVSFLYLGMMSLWSNDFSAADNNLEKAAFLDPHDPQILNALAFAQNGAHKYADVLRTANQLHRLDHRGMADVHYVAAAAALSLRDINSSKTELATFLRENPAGPLSALARETLSELQRGTKPLVQTRASIQEVPVTSTLSTFPNTQRLRSELSAVATEPESEDDPTDPISGNDAVPSPTLSSTIADGPNPYVIRQAVDETALFLSISEHGRSVDDLSLSDIQIWDDKKPPERILQFLTQSKLPLRLGVLIDTSGSVEHRIGFEQSAAKNFLSRVLNTDSDLAFIAGFDTDVSVTQDFTADQGDLERGVDNLRHHGEGTAVFDAVHFACWKLAAYPDQSRVARVLVILSDGEDNSSHRSLKQSIKAAEAAGIIVYALNTSENFDLQTDASRVLQIIAERSGGESIRPRSLGELEQYFRQLSEVIRSRYMIAYKPADFLPNGSYRRLKVKAEHDGRRLQVHVRKGYYASMALNQ